MLRQTWDHLFGFLAPEEDVRESPFFTLKPEPRPNQVTRLERIKFALDRHVRDAQQKALLEATSVQMIDLYNTLNAAHTRGDIDRAKSRAALNSLYQWLTQWADALGI